MAGVRSAAQMGLPGLCAGPERRHRHSRGRPGNGPHRCPLLDLRRRRLGLIGWPVSAGGVASSWTSSTPCPPICRQRARLVPALRRLVPRSARARATPSVGGPRVAIAAPQGLEISPRSHRDVLGRDRHRPRSRVARLVGTRGRLAPGRGSHRVARRDQAARQHPGQRGEAAGQASRSSAAD
jgi:hypothetical protein